MFDRIRGVVPRLWSLAIMLSIGICVMLLAAMGVIYFQQQRTQAAIATQIPIKSRIVESFRARADVFEAQLNEAEGELTTARASLPTELKAENIYRAIFNLAEEAQVTAVITPSLPKEIKLQEISYRMLPYSIRVEGAYTAVTNFIAVLDVTQDALPTLVVDSVSVTNMAGPLSGASLEITVYVLKT